MRIPRLFNINDASRRARLCTAAGALSLVMAAFLFHHGCGKTSLPGTEPDGVNEPARQSGGEAYLVEILDELELIAETPAGFRQETISPGSAARGGRGTIVLSTTTDTTFVYGEITPDGLGAVVTERHKYPKGILLITVRKTHGEPGGGVVSETKKYISFADLSNDSAQQSTVTEVVGLSADTILTHVVRNGILETYTFRLPVVTRVVSPVDGSVRVTSRFGSAGTVVSEVRDGSGSLIQHRENNGLGDGSVVSYTLFADSTWRRVRTVGESDGTIFRDITSGP